MACNGYEDARDHGYICQTGLEVTTEIDLVCAIDTGSTDADGDDTTYTIEWEVDGVAYTDATTTYVTGDTVPAADYSGGETWTCTVTPK